MKNSELVFYLFLSCLTFLIYLLLAIRNYKESRKRMKEDLEREQSRRKKILENQIEEKERKEFHKDRTGRTKSVFFISQEKYSEIFGKEETDELDR